MKEKTTESRVSEAIKIRQKMREVGLSEEDEQVQQLCKVLNDYVRGVGYTGKIRLDQYDRVALVKLSLQDQVENTIVLRSVGAEQD